MEGKNLTQIYNKKRYAYDNKNIQLKWVLIKIYKSRLRVITVCIFGIPLLMRNNPLLRSYSLIRNINSWISHFA